MKLQPISTSLFSQAVDESSVCSTFAIEQHQKTRSSSVRFDLASNQEIISPDICQEDVPVLWYVAADYKHFKKNFIDLAKQFQRYDRKQSDEPGSFKAMLLKAFNSCRDAQSDDARACFLSSRRDEKALRQWLSKGSRRGVERVSVLSIFADKSARRKKLTEAVLQAQDTHQDTESIRQAALEISRPARLFAWRLAL